MAATTIDITDIDRIVEENGRAPESVIPILQAIQTRYRYLPDEALKRVCELTEITAASIEGVASFYSQFRRKPVGRHMISVCDGTACHVNNSEDILESVQEVLELRNGQDTDADGVFTVQKVACLGCCSLAPAIQIDGVTYAHLRRDTVKETLEDFLVMERAKKEAPHEVQRHVVKNGAEIRVGLDSCCVAGGSAIIREALERALAEIGSETPVKHVSCVHMCHQVPVVEVVLPDKDPALYVKVRPEDAPAIVARHFKPRSALTRIRSSATQWLDRFYVGDTSETKPLLERHDGDAREEHVSSFLSHQRHIATEHRGELDPGDLDEYLRRGGFMAMEKCLLGKATGAVLLNRHRGGNGRGLSANGDAWTPEQIIEEILNSGLRGRGGAGFLTGRKWQFVREAPGGKKYIICNGDEGDPGAFMDRMILESYSYRVIEGMILAARAVGANEGYLYIRAEYPLATRRMRQAIKDCEAAGLLGGNILGTDFSLHLTVKEGAGAFVCGEETALIASLEGRRGTPSIRPPYPAQEGLYGCPTLINNVETFSMVSWIIRNGAAAFSAMGTEKSKGTKVFSLAGKIKHGGLIEVPMGITLREIVEDIGGGIRDGRQFKAVLVGGPSGGCIPASLADIRVDYEALTQAGAMMGSGGMVVLDDSDCMVEMARYFLSFTQHESCGKCVPCRIGTKRMLEMLTRLCDGTAKEADIELLEQLAHVVKNQSLCGLGKTAPNPVLTALEYFREEFDAHVQKKCPAGKCKALIDFWIEDNCIGCTLCAQACPVDCIVSHPYTLHVIELDRCTRCDACRVACPVDAVKSGSR
ncbi:MAG: NADH-quinone oxidoreductase subunit NuoE [Candidatus Hydrogenedentes bacterium]|nr:NADH-quinone oxidoreductase subunit NuoE [Candidatus Hydrogenedentota bacterium]